MPTYYNGKEITSTTIMSGVDLTGKSSIEFGGKTISIGSAPPRPITYTFVDTRNSDPNQACSIGTSSGSAGSAFELYGSSDSTIDIGVILYNDMELTDIFMPRSLSYYYCFDTNEVVLFDKNGRGILSTFRC